MDDYNRFCQAFRGDPWAPPSSSDRVTAVMALLEAGLDPNARSEEGWSFLMHAALFGEAEVVRLLLERGADPDAQEEEGFTALMMAAEHGHLEVMKQLMDFGAGLECRNEYGTALTCAAMIGKPDSVRLLIERGADLQARDDQGKTALQHADEEASVAREMECDLIVAEAYEAVARILREAGA